jgi:hypothetical protein
MPSARGNTNFLEIEFAAPMWGMKHTAYRVWLKC